MESNIGVGEYRKEDYQEIFRISEDKDNMEDTWKKWKTNKNRTIKKLQNMGLKTIDIIVKPKELVNYCQENGLRINGKSRAQFISYKAMKLNKK